jgi:hypothetical protein
MNPQDLAVDTDERKLYEFELIIRNTKSFRKETTTNL